MNAFTITQEEKTVTKFIPCQTCSQCVHAADDALLDRKAAAAYLGGLSPGTLAVWDCTKRYDLKPIKVGTAVRYRKSVLDKFLEEQTRP